MKNQKVDGSGARKLKTSSVAEPEKLKDLRFGAPKSKINRAKTKQINTSMVAEPEKTKKLV